MNPSVMPRSLTRRSLLAALACGAAPALGAQDGPGASVPGARRAPWPAGRPTPALELPVWEGARWRLADARGQPVLLNFWASWCEPCRAEMPSLEALAVREAGKGLKVVAVNFRETDGAIRRFLDRTPLALPILRDSDGGAAKDWGVRIYPTTIAVDRRGRAAFSVIGELDWAGDTARQWLAPLW